MPRHARTWIGLLALVVTLTVSGRAAQADGVAPPVEELVAQALAGAPSLAALEARLAAARERVGPAGAFPDPMLEIAGQAMGLPEVGPNSTASIELRQELPFPGKRRARREAARAGAEVNAALTERARRETAAAVRSTYARIYALDREREALRAAETMLDLLSASATARYAVGDADQEAVLKIQLERSRIGERLDELAAERAAEEATLARLLGVPGDLHLGEVRALPEPAWPEGDLVEGARSGAPEVVAGAAMVREAEARAREAHLDRFPDFAVGAGSGVDGMGEPLAMARFGMQLPLWRRWKQTPLLRAAENDLAAVREELREAQVRTAARAAALSARWQAERRRIARTEEGILPQSRAAFEAARAAYLAGRGDFGTVIEDFRLWLDGEVELARRRASAFAAWAEVTALVVPSPGRPDEGGGR